MIRRARALTDRAEGRTKRTLDALLRKRVSAVTAALLFVVASGNDAGTDKQCEYRNSYLFLEVSLPAERECCVEYGEGVAQIDVGVGRPMYASMADASGQGLDRSTERRTDKDKSGFEGAPPPMYAVGRRSDAKRAKMALAADPNVTDDGGRAARAGGVESGLGDQVTAPPRGRLRQHGGCAAALGRRCTRRRGSSSQSARSCGAGKGRRPCVRPPQRRRKPKWGIRRAPGGGSLERGCGAARIVARAWRKCEQGGLEGQDALARCRTRPSGRRSWMAIGKRRRPAVVGQCHDSFALANVHRAAQPVRSPKSACRRGISAS